MKNYLTLYGKPFLFAINNCRAGTGNMQVHREKNPPVFFRNPQVNYLELSVSFLTPTGLGNTGVLGKAIRKIISFGYHNFVKEFKKEITLEC
jgi:hypothetical protein